MPNKLIHSFLEDGTQFHISNAVWLARLSQAVYIKNPSDAGAWSRKQGLTLEKWDWRKQGATHAGLWTTANHIFVVFRGTNEGADWRDNAAIGRMPHDWGNVHGGFFRALERIEYELITDITTHLAEENRAIWISGHSLGGALATLMAAKLRLANLPVEGIYTFGQPHVGNRAFVNQYNEDLKDRTYRVVNHMDLVTRLLQGVYHHAGHLVMLGRKEGYRIGGPDRPDREPGESPRRSSSRVKPRISRRKALSLNDHKVARYITKLEAIENQAG